MQDRLEKIKELIHSLQLEEKVSATMLHHPEDVDVIIKELIKADYLCEIQIQ